MLRNRIKSPPPLYMMAVDRNRLSESLTPQSQIHPTSVGGAPASGESVPVSGLWSASPREQSNASFFSENNDKNNKKESMLPFLTLAAGNLVKFKSQALFSFQVPGRIYWIIHILSNVCKSSMNWSPKGAAGQGLPSCLSFVCTPRGQADTRLIVAGVKECRPPKA